MFSTESKVQFCVNERAARGRICPKENQKSHYLKALWLLSEFNRARKYLGQDEQLEKNRATVERWIEELRPK